MISSIEHDSIKSSSKYVVPDDLKELVHLIGRLFYEGKYIVVLDMLAEEGLLRDDTISIRLHMNIRDSNKIALKLRDDRLIQSEAKADSKSQEMNTTKTITHYYYYIDFHNFVNVCKYKMLKMRLYLEERIGKEEEQNYFCPSCMQKYKSLDFDRLLNISTGQILCEFCKTELQAEEHEQFHDTREEFSKFMEQTVEIIKILKKTDHLSISKFDPYLWIDEAVKIAIQETTLAEISNAIEEPKFIPSALNVQFSLGLDNDQKDIKSTPSIPHWHVHSTITGERLISPNLQQTAKESNFESIQDRTMYYEKYYTELSQQQVDHVPISEPIQSSTKQVDFNVYVTVSGEKISLQNITDADIDKMTPEEYEEYFNTLKS